tara:strand:+ start:2398 stop:2739 length:342 start_codon:yes stop_codon:yes gene_type:complete
MDFQQKYIEDDFKITEEVSDFCLALEPKCQFVIYEAFEIAWSVMDDVQSSFVLNVDNETFIEANCVNYYDEYILIDEIKFVEDMDIYLDHLNLNKTFTWNSSTRTLEKINLND